MTKGSVLLGRISALALVSIVLFLPTANAQDRCGTLADVLRFGVDETEVDSLRDKARRLHRFACDEQSRSRERRDSGAVNASYSLFSADARNNSSSLDEYRKRHCSLTEDDVATIVSDSFRLRSVNPAVVNAWSACISNQTGVLLDPRLDQNQKVASFSITYDARRVPRAPALRGISSRTFTCQTAGGGRAIGVGGEPLEISPTDALVVRCDRGSEPGELDGRQVAVYREDSLILDLTTGGHRIDFVERKERPAVEEFAELQAQVRNLNAALAALMARAREVRIQSGLVMLPDIRSEPSIGGQKDGATYWGFLDRRVDFPMPFDRAPVVYMALAGADVDRRTAFRLRVRVTSIDREGFEYDFVSWNRTRVYGASASWMAVLP